MYPQHSYLRGNPGPAGYPERNPFLFGAPLVGGLLGGFLGSALLIIRVPMRIRLFPTVTEVHHTVQCRMAEVIPVSIRKNGLRRSRPFFIALFLPRTYCSPAVYET